MRESPGPSASAVERRYVSLRSLVPSELDMSMGRSGEDLRQSLRPGSVCGLAGPVVSPGLRSEFVGVDGDVVTLEAELDPCAVGLCGQRVCGVEQNLRAGQLEYRDAVHLEHESPP